MPLPVEREDAERGSPSLPVRQCVIPLDLSDPPPGPTPGSTPGPTPAPLPAPLLPCGDRPFLFWLMRELQRFGIDEFVLLAAPRPPAARAGFERATGTAIAAIRARLPRPARITLHSPPGTTPWAMLRHAAPLLHERFLWHDGSTVFGGNLARFLAHADRAPAHPHWMLLRAVVPGEVDACPTVLLDREPGRITGFAPPDADRTRLVDGGIHLLQRSALEHDPAPPDRAVLPRLAAAGLLGGLFLPGPFHLLPSPSDAPADSRADSLAEHRRAFGAALARSLLRPAVFLDRDGVINVDHGYVGTRDRFEWTPRLHAALRRLCDRGFHVFVVTNQSGVARGFYSEDQLRALMSWAEQELRAHGATIDDWRYCPTHPDALLPRYRAADPRRKPGTGMIDELVSAWEIDRARSHLFGDQPSDLLAAAAAGLRGHRVGPPGLAELVLDGNLPA